MKIGSSYLRVEYIFIFFSIIWPIFSNLLGFDQAGRFVDLLMVATIFANLPNRKFRKRVLFLPTIVWAIWLLYVFIQFTIMHHPIFDKDIYIYYFQMLSPYVIMLISVDRILLGKLDELLTVFLCGYLVFAFLSAVSLGSEISADTRTIIDYRTDPNDVALAASYAIFIVVLKWFLRKISLQDLFIIAIPTLAVVVNMASRTALFVVVLIFIATLYVLIFKTKITPRKKLTLMTIVVVSIALFFVVVSNSYLSERVATTNTITRIETGTVLDKMGDRGPFYYFGFMEFIQSPIFGIGIKNFGPNGVYRDLVCHSEYMVNLAETGIIGAVIFWTFIISLVCCYFKTLKRCIPFDKVFILIALGIPLFVSLFFWTYDRSYIFFSYALVLAFYRKSVLIKKYDR